MAFVNRFPWFKNIHKWEDSRHETFFLHSLFYINWKHDLENLAYDLLRQQLLSSLCGFFFFSVNVKTANKYLNILVFISKLETKWHLFVCTFRFFQNLIWKFLVCMEYCHQRNFQRSTSSIVKNKSYKNILNNGRPKIDSCGMPYFISFQKL